MLIIDEFDAVATEIIKPILSFFRGMYLERNQPSSSGLHSIILVGVRNLPALLEGTQSPFNIADQFTIPYFDPTEVADLLSQHIVTLNGSVWLDGEQMLITPVNLTTGAS